MDKNVSIVRVDTRHYRVIARENWGLTKEQMKGKHVHHRVKRSEGGTNDPSNLYVCSEWYHDNVWHAKEGGFAGCASLGAAKAHKERDENGKSLVALRTLAKIHAQKDERGRSLLAMKTMEKLHAQKDEQGRSIVGVENAKRMHAIKDDQGRSVNAVKAAQSTNALKDENGKSVNALKGLDKIHGEKDESGKSLAGIKYAQRMHAEKDEFGRSIAAMKASKQKWRCLVTGYVTAPGPLSLYQKARGIDTSLREQVG